MAVNVPFLGTESVLVSLAVSAVAGLGGVMGMTWYALQTDYPMRDVENPLTPIFVAIFFSLWAIPTGLLAHFGLVTPLLVPIAELWFWVRTERRDQGDGSSLIVVYLSYPVCLLAMAVLAGAEYWLGSAVLV